MSVTTACSEQYHGVGLSFDCSITIRPRDYEDLQVPGKAPVSSAFQVAPTGIIVSGGLESVGGFIQEVHVKRIPPDRTAPIASIGEGYSLTSYDPQDRSLLFQQIRKLKPNASFRAPFTLDGTRTLTKRDSEVDASDGPSKVTVPSQSTDK